MSYYDEKQTGELRKVLEARILSWSGVEKKKMMGCPCYMANGKLFAIMVTGGVVITRLTDAEREGLGKVHPFKPFVAHNTVKKWAHLALKKSEIDKILPWVETSYRAALRESKP
jgi:hypothetical protein